MIVGTEQREQPVGNASHIAALQGIQIVLVLYKTALPESAAYCSLLEVLAHTGAQSRVRLLVCDNSPEGQPVDTLRAIPGEYRHQPANPGLAASYNLALQHAIDGGRPWLMLLDQDTVLTAEYMKQALHLTETLADSKEVIALVPRLVQNGHLHSPYNVSGPALPLTFQGAAPEPLQAFNSGAILRICALQAIGGFPMAFWLDFLDHATFHLLQQRGRIFVMPVTLQHELFTNAPVRAWSSTYLQRHGNVLRAESKFYREYGTRRQRWQYRLRLLRHAYGSVKHLRLPMLWQTLGALLVSV